MFPSWQIRVSEEVARFTFMLTIANSHLFFFFFFSELLIIWVRVKENQMEKFKLSNKRLALSSSQYFIYFIYLKTEKHCHHHSILYIYFIYLKTENQVVSEI